MSETTQDRQMITTCQQQEVFSYMAPGWRYFPSCWVFAK